MRPQCNISREHTVLSTQQPASEKPKIYGDSVAHKYSPIQIRQTEQWASWWSAQLWFNQDTKLTLCNAKGTGFVADRVGLWFRWQNIWKCSFYRMTWMINKIFREFYKLSSIKINIIMWIIFHLHYNFHWNLIFHWSSLFILMKYNSRYLLHYNKGKANSRKIKMHAEDESNH